VDAVYIALPISMHAEYTIRAAKAGVHVLCEKPMAVTADECEAMIDACEKHRVKLMIAYRLHFEEINLKAVELVRRGRIGEPKFFNSSFSMTVKGGDIRTRKDMGGGALYDIGVYCINAARCLFRAEPQEVMAISVNSGAAKLSEIDESTGALLRFLDTDGGERVAAFVTSFQRRRRRLLSHRRHQGPVARRSGVRVCRGLHDSHVLQAFVSGWLRRLVPQDAIREVQQLRRELVSLADPFPRRLSIHCQLVA
jgi:predicted dehydrogenase